MVAVTIKTEENEETKDPFLSELRALRVVDPNEVLPGGSSMFDQESSSDKTAISTINKRVQSLGYKPLGKALKAAVLANILKERGINVFSNETVDEYMKNVLAKKNFAFDAGIITTYMFLSGMQLTILGIASFAILGIVSIWVTIAPLIWNISWTVTLISLAAFLASLFFLHFLTLPLWRWETTSLKEYQSQIPMNIVERVEIINNITKVKNLSVIFEVHELKRELFDIGDPFLSVRVKNTDIRYYIGVWNESSFKGKSYLP